MSAEPKMRSTNDRFFFVHLQKTAGTTIYLLLRRQFPESEIYPVAADGDRIASIISVPHLVEQWERRGHEISVVTGHFPLCTAELLGGGFRTFTVVREPVERTLSYLRHHRSLSEEDRDKSLEEIYDIPFRFNGLIHNHMVKMFSLTTDEMIDGALTEVTFDRDRLERAKRNLESVELVGIQEEFDTFWEQVPRQFGWDLGEQQFTNRTQKVAVPDTFCQRIAQDNALDIEFYEFACELARARAAGIGG